MMTKISDRAAYQCPAVQPQVRRESKPQTEDHLIEEILKAAGLEALD